MEVGLPGHRVRYVLPAFDEQVLDGLGREHDAPGTWIKVAGEPELLRKALPGAWAMADTAYLMQVPFRAGEKVGHPVRVVRDGPVVHAEILGEGGERAAWGRMAPAGTVGVIDQVETDPGHRRRGFGSAVMRTLADAALDLGLSTGVLAATADGRALYQALGWSVAGPLAAAHVPEAHI